jgi:hypothetical protein
MWFDELADGRMACTDVRVHSIAGGIPHEVTSTLMREIPFGTLIDATRLFRAQSDARAAQAQLSLRDSKERRRRGERSIVLNLTPPTALVKSIERRLRGQAGKPGRPPVRNADFYAKVAQVYSEAYRRSESPTRAVSQARRELGVILSSSAAAKAVRRARSLGFLGPTEKGKAGGAIRPRRKRT